MRWLLRTSENICKDGAELYRVKVAIIPDIRQITFGVRKLNIPLMHFEEGEFETGLSYKFYVEITKYEESMICPTVSLFEFFLRLLSSPRLSSSRTLCSDETSEPPIMADWN
jgi:hypothetical protein